MREYFEAVIELSSKMEKQLAIILLRAFATVRKNPRELVSSSTLHSNKSYPKFK